MAETTSAKHPSSRYFLSSSSTTKSPVGSNEDIDFPAMILESLQHHFDAKDSDYHTTSTQDENYAVPQRAKSTKNMSDSISRHELDAKLETIETKMDARADRMEASFREVLDQMQILHRDVVSIKEDNKALRSDIIEENKSLHTEIIRENYKLQGEVKADNAALRAEIKSDNKNTRMTVVTTSIASVIAIVGLVAAIMGITGSTQNSAIENMISTQNAAASDVNNWMRDAVTEMRSSQRTTETAVLQAQDNGVKLQALILENTDTFKTSFNKLELEFKEVKQTLTPLKSDQ